MCLFDLYFKSTSLTYVKLEVWPNNLILVISVLIHTVQHTNLRSHLLVFLYPAFIVFLVPLGFPPLNLYVDYKKVNSKIIWVKPLPLMENFLFYT